MIDYGKIPKATLLTLQRYVHFGVPPGGFVTAVLRNDLIGAFQLADNEHRACLYEITHWLYNCAPIACWGGTDAVEAWSRRMMDPRNREAVDRCQL